MLQETIKRLSRVPASERGEFVAKSERIARSMGIPVDWLIAIMYNESGLDPKAFNPDGGGGGLIGFMPSTARQLFNLSIEQIRSMSRLDQLDLVQRYFSRYPDQFKNISDLYLWNFYPYAIGKKDWYVIGIEKGTDFARKVARSNPIFDLNKDGLIHLGEFKEYTRRRWPELSRGSRLRTILLGAALIIIFIVLVVLVIAGRKMLLF